MMMETAKMIKTIEAKIARHKLRGYGAVDINVNFISIAQRQEVRNYFEPKMKRYIDWGTDDQYGLGVGRNMNGALVDDGCLTIDWGFVLSESDCESTDYDSD